MNVDIAHSINFCDPHICIVYFDSYYYKLNFKIKTSWIKTLRNVQKMKNMNSMPLLMPKKPKQDMHAIV
jgi:hypothetical protein